ncbi:MAG: cytochrome c [Nitrospirae bacterium]|nr:cytochrome c [Nitrospirota bacterium]
MGKWLRLPAVLRRALLLRVVLALALFLPPLIRSGHAEARGDAKAGKVVYDKNCAACHGPKGSGLGARSILPNFADAKYMATRTDAELFDKLSNGGKGTGMPAWGKVLTDHERWNVLAYIRTLSGP